MSYFEDYYQPKKRSFIPYIVISLISAMIGGLLVLGLGPLFFGDINNRGLNNESAQPPLPQASLDTSPVVAIAENVGPTVVGVSNRVASRNYFNKTTTVEQGSGSGVIIDKRGYIVTNYHVIQGATEVIVNLADGRQVEAEIRGSDPRTDLAVLKINAEDLPVANLGTSENLKPGELVVAIGNPLGYEFARSVTVGVVSAVDRTITIGDQRFKLIQTDAAINPGNSGGALLNSQGQLIGINSAKLVIQGVEGMGFAIPISDAKPIINELIEKGYVSRPWLGIYGGVIDEITSKQYDMPMGIYIERIIPKGPADMAGLDQEDIIVAVEGQKVKDFDVLNSILKKYKPGDKIKVLIYRDNKEATIELILGEMPRQ